MVKIGKKILVLIVMLILEAILSIWAYSQEERDPFKECFPEKIESVEEVLKEPEKVFDVSPYKLNGLLWGSGDPKAIINNEIYGVGDRLAEAEITKIDKYGVTLIFNNQEYTINPTKTISMVVEETQGGGR
jgi:hypothetical protein